MVVVAAEGAGEQRLAVEAEALGLAEVVPYGGRLREVVEAVQQFCQMTPPPVRRRQPADPEWLSRRVPKQTVQWKDRAQQNMSYRRRLL